VTPPADPTFASLTEIARALRRRSVSPVELARVYLEQIDEGRRLRAFISPPGAASLREARRAEQRLAGREAGALLGVPIAIKDLFATRAIRTTGGSKILRDWLPSKDAGAVGRLRAAGAVIFGKTNLHEFAYGVTNANPWWGIARNPHDETRIPGGSSGGSAIAVVTGMAAAALGSDTGGSIRIPAALCGCVGLKPTYGVVPLDGALPLGWSLDHAGPLTRTVDDAGLLFDVLSDSTTWHKARRAGARALRGLRVGVLGGGLLTPSEPRVAAAVEKATQGLRQHGMRVRETRIPALDWTVATQLVTLRSEATAVHARWLRSRPGSYGRDVRVRLQLGALITASDYVLAQRMRARLREAVRRAFDEVDVLLLPTTPITAPLIGARTVNWRTGPEPVDGALVRLTAPFNLTGVPAISVPWRQPRGLPIGLQIVGRWNDEATVLAVGRELEDLSR
jgi:aspartyl-tRNA(Asn)/glutamyl-tRNA(Gln) amidotransferase subunit A